MPAPFVRRCKRSPCAGFTCLKGFMVSGKGSLCSSTARNVVRACNALPRIAPTRVISLSLIPQTRQKTLSSTISTDPFYPVPQVLSFLIVVKFPRRLVSYGERRHKLEHL